MAIENGNGGKMKSITHDLSDNELGHVDAEWDVVQMHKRALIDAQKRQTDVQDGLVQINTWANATREERQENAAYQTYLNAFHTHMYGLAEAAAKTAAFLIATAIEREPQFTSMSAPHAARELVGMVAGALPQLADESVEFAQNGDPIGFLRWDSKSLANTIIRESAERTWNMAEIYMQDHEISDPLIRLVKDAYENLFNNLRAGHRVQRSKKRRQAKQKKPKEGQS